MTSREQPHRDEMSLIRDDMTSTTAAEDTPLLQSERSSSSPPTSLSSAGINRPQDEDLDIANQTVTKQRAVAIILSVYILIFLQGIAHSFHFPTQHRCQSLEDMISSSAGVFLVLMTAGPSN